jgi:hypothetical protein
MSDSCIAGSSVCSCWLFYIHPILPLYPTYSMHLLRDRESLMGYCILHLCSLWKTGAPLILSGPTVFYHAEPEPKRSRISLWWRRNRSRRSRNRSSGRHINIFIRSRIKMMRLRNIVCFVTKHRQIGIQVIQKENHQHHIKQKGQKLKLISCPGLPTQTEKKIP